MSIEDAYEILLDEIDCQRWIINAVGDIDTRIADRATGALEALKRVLKQLGYEV